MNRRFVNLVVLSGYKNPMYSLHRLDVTKHLFYPSTADAETANAKNADNNNGGKPPRIEKLQRLPAPSMRLQTHLDGVYSPPGDMFSILTPRGGGDAGRILHTNEQGHVLLCDVQSCSTKTMSCLEEAKGWHPISFAVPGADLGDESLYGMRSVPMPQHGFEVLHLGSGSPEQKRLYLGLGSPELKWQPLPPSPSAPYESPRIDSSALLDDGRIICVSTGEGIGTYCFDTESQEWWRAGDLALPFDGTAVHVPELDTWLGFSPDHPYHLCAVDLSGVAMAPPQAPTLQHVWEDFHCRISP